jgi:L-ascorbate metabolism protein UlaG (beta-lactamase superfamily)
MYMRITWLGHATFLIESGTQAVYIDPYLEPYAALRLPKATLVLISHWHPDHCTRESVEMLLTDTTTLIGTVDAAREFNGCIALREGETKRADEINVRAMPARTHNHIGGHDTEGFVIGFLLELEKKKLYYTSDTDFLPAMTGLAPDVVLIPVGGTTTMNAAEAARAVHAMNAKLAIPALWGSRTGTRDDAEVFKELLEHQHSVVILEQGEMIEL